MKMTMTLILAVFTFNLFAAPDKMDPKQQEMMAKWKELSTPTEAHKVLSQAAGTWTYTSKNWHSADAAPEESKGTSTIKMILGGRFLHQEVKGMAMGMKFEGMGLVGYNTMTKKYETTWIDSMSTAMMSGTGDYNAGTQTLTDAGEFTCPMTENKKSPYRTEWKFVDKNHMVFSMFGNGMGSTTEFKMMELNYVRR